MIPDNRYHPLRATGTAALLVIALLAVAALAATGRTARAVIITANSQHLWLLSELPTSSDRPGRIHYGHAHDPDGRLYTVRTLPRIPAAASAFGDTLYYVIQIEGTGEPPSRLAVRQLRALTDEPRGPHRFSEPRPLPPIPVGLELVDLLADADGPVLLVRDSDGLRVLRVRETEWRDLWTGDRPPLAPGAFLLGTDAEVLVAQPAADTIRLTELATGNSRTIPWRTGAHLRALGRDFALVTHDGDALVIRAVWGNQAPIRASIGQLPVDTVILTEGDRLALFWEAEDSSAREVLLRRRLVALDGTTGPVQELAVAGPMTSREIQALALVMTSLFLTIVVFILKPESRDAVPIPEGTSLADPSRRLLAFLIDLLPPAAAAALAWQRPVTEILNVPVLLQGRLDLAPPLTAAVLLILVSAATEARWGGTPGKILLACRVVDRRGNRPGFWISVARNAVKVLCPPLALFVLLAPAAPKPGDFNVRVIVRHDDRDGRDDSAE